MDVKRSEKTAGIQLLVERGREAFRIAENINFYSEKDYKAADITDPMNIKLDGHRLTGYNGSSSRAYQQHSSTTTEMTHIAMC
ncbi:MAG: hypothetical protein P8X96_26215 [Desulfobacteraceae bacterium]